MNTPMYTVLFIDDDTTQVRAAADTLRLHLREKHIEFAFFTSLVSVEQWLKTCTTVPLIAIVDLWMNDIGSNEPDTKAGFKVIKSIRQRFPQVYVMVVSAHIDADARETLKGWPNIAIISKPVAAERLLALVDTLIAGMLPNE